MIVCPDDTNIRTTAFRSGDPLDARTVLRGILDSLVGWHPQHPCVHIEICQQQTKWKMLIGSINDDLRVKTHSQPVPFLKGSVDSAM